MDGQAGTARLEAVTAASGGFRQLLRLGFSAHGLLLALAAIYLGAYQVLSLAVPGVHAADAGEVMLGIVFFSIPAVLFGLLTYSFVLMAAVEKPERPIVALFGNVKAILSNPQRMAAGIPAALALVIFMYVFTMLKAAISVLVPFSWDQTFDHLDVAIHFGHHPWQLLQPLFGWWPITFLINLNYNMWFVVMSVFWAYYAFIAKPGPQRTRFFLSYMLIWMVGGGLMAVFFSSAGPCYFTRLGISPDPYAPLMAYLDAANTHAPIWALSTQDMLWSLKLDHSGFGGVSAMPSMHNATALLFVLMCPFPSRLVRRILTVHMSFIFLGSILLGWHYAVDGYAAIVLSLGLWLAMGPVSRWWHQTEASCRFDDALDGAR